jgi:hypothetical protein
VTRVASDLAVRFGALTYSQKLIASGFLACCAGFVIWAFGYLVGETLGLFSALRPIGVVIVIVGTGFFCLGSVFHLTEVTGKPSE